MSNPVSGLISSALKSLHTDHIQALLTDVTVPCRLIYAGTRYEDCPSCIGNPAGNIGSVYSAGGPIPNTICENCGGSGKRLVEKTETIKLCVLWDYKDFIKPIRYSRGMVQTLSDLTETIDKIKQAQEIIIDTSIEPYVSHRFVRDGEPNPMGLGESSFIVTTWKKV